MAQSAKKKVYRNFYSSHVRDEDNHVLLEVMGPQRVFTHSAIAKFLYTSGPSHNSWNDGGCGFVCLVRDRDRKSYFIQFVNMEKQSISWEEEIYSGMELVSHGTTFVSFEAKNCVAGFAFPYKEERDGFKNSVFDILKAYVRYVKAKNRFEDQQVKFDSNSTGPDDKAKKEKDKKTWMAPLTRFTIKRKTKTEEFVIGNPEEFRKEKLPSTMPTPEEIGQDKMEILLRLLKKDGARIEKNEMDKIIRCIQKCGGIDKLIESVSSLNKQKSQTVVNKSDPKPPPSSVPAPPIKKPLNSNNSIETPPIRPPPPPPSRSNQNVEHTPDQEAPPPSPSDNSTSSVSSASHSQPPPVPSKSSSSASLVPPPPPPISSKPSSAPQPPPNKPAGSDERNSLLSAIQKGKSLKKVEESVNPPKNDPPLVDEADGSIDLTDTLMNALKMMRPDLEYSDDDQEESGGSDFDDFD